MTLFLNLIIVQFLACLWADIPTPSSAFISLAAFCSTIGFHLYNQAATPSQHHFCTQKSPSKPPKKKTTNKNTEKPVEKSKTKIPQKGKKIRHKNAPLGPSGSPPKSDGASFWNCCSCTWESGKSPQALLLLT